jgi:hypothetical protein
MPTLEPRSEFGKEERPTQRLARRYSTLGMSSLIKTTAAQLLERCTAQPELHATLQTAFKAIEDMLIGQEKTINDYDAEIYLTSSSRVQRDS